MLHEFESLESAHDFVTLLAETVAEAKLDLEADVQQEGFSRRQDALQITLYSLRKLEVHVNRTSRILNDLRSMRRLRFDERVQAFDDCVRALMAGCEVSHIP